MDYEVFLADTQVYIKEIKEKSDAQSKTAKKIDKCVSDGDVTALPKLISSLRETTREREEAINNLEMIYESFNGQEYMMSGDFTEQMIECCRQLGVDVQGSFPVYEMFPCRVTINPESQDVTIDRKKLSCLRPSRLISDIKKELDKLSRVSFNAQLFAKELAAAYDLAVIRASRKKNCAPNAPMYALDLYDILTPMRRYKREYTKNNFAYDLARLYAQGEMALDDGRKLRFDTVRDMRKAIRILDRHGAEQFISTIRLN